ncbi:MAG: hypothetical protein ACP5E5_10760 [Acidobacteriaceae bacterium]
MPRTILIDAPPGVDRAQALRILGLTAGAELSEQQIEAALGRLANTGLFSEISYTVSPSALIVKLTPSASSVLRRVRLANFAWWEPTQLEALLEAAVPGYHGRLPLAGTLTDQVKAALVALLKGKGIQAEVEARQSARDDGVVTLRIIRPSILVDQVILPGSLPELRERIKKFTDTLYNADFDSDRDVRAVHDNVMKIYRDAGYLDVAVTTPEVSTPKGDLFNYAVDLTATVQPGALFHLASLDVSALPAEEQTALARDVPTTPDTVDNEQLWSAIGHALSQFGNAHFHLVAKKDQGNHTVTLQILPSAAGSSTSPATM